MQEDEPVVPLKTGPRKFQCDDREQIYLRRPISAKRGGAKK